MDNPRPFRANVTGAEAGQCVSVALKRIRRAVVRKGMVLVNKTDVPPRGEHSTCGEEVIIIAGMLFCSHSEVRRPSLDLVVRTTRIIKI